MPSLLRLASLLLSAAPALAAQTTVDVAPSKSSAKRLSVAFTNGPHEGLATHSRVKWGKALRESAPPERTLVVSVGGNSDPKLVAKFMEVALTRYGFDELRVPAEEAERWQTLAAKVQDELGPMVLTARVVDEASYRVGVQWGDETFSSSERADLIERLRAAHAAKPKQRWVLDYNGLDLACLAWLRGMQRQIQHGPLQMRNVSKDGEARWMAADGAPAIFDIGFDGSISREGSVLTSPGGEAAELSKVEQDYADEHFGMYGGSPYQAFYLAYLRLAEKSRKVDIHTRPRITIAAKRFLFRAHRSAPWIHVERMLEIAAATRAPRVDFSLWARPLSEAQPIDPKIYSSGLEATLDTNGAIVTAEPVPIQLEVVEPGERVEEISYSPFDGAELPTLRYDASRKIRYVMTGGSVDSMGELEKLLRTSKEGGADFALVLACDPGITAGDVFPLLRAAGELGLGPVSFEYSLGEPDDDYSVASEAR